MRVPKGVNLVFFVALLAGLLPLTAAAERAPIEQELLDALAADGRVDFFVKMAVEADLRAAYEIADWSARGQYVYNALREVAAPTQAPVIAYAREHGLEHTSFLTMNAVFIRGGDLAAAEALAELPGVAYLRLEGVLEIPDPFVGGRAGINGFVEADATIAWGITDTKADQVWQLGVRGAGIKVASIDTGVQWDHPALVGQFACPGDPSNPACWSDPSNICGGSACDNNGHGTHIMGTMVALDDDSLPYIAGMAPDATWIACKGCETNSCSDFALTTCADWILAPDGDPDNRPGVVNNSWGGGGGDAWYMSYVNAWRAAGTFPTFAVGSQGSGCGTLGSPGDYQESFGNVAHDVDRNISSFSARGPSAFGHDPYTKPNLSAPGVSICSTVPGNGWNCSYSGTAMASPHSAGAVALVWSGCPDHVGQTDLTFELLQDNADAPPPGNCGAPPDGEGNYTYGYGYLNALAAIEECTGGAGLGTLQGHVYDENMDPIEGASVIAQPATAGSVDSVTDPNGFYTMQLVSGFYDVTASQYGYTTETEYDVEVIENQITQQDFTLTSVPVWHSGAPGGFDWYRFDAVYNPNDGLIYFLGGSAGSVHDKSIWTYDPVTEASADTNIDMIYNAANITINYIEDDGTGRGEAFYVLGGYDVALAVNIDKVQRFYPQTGEVEELVNDPYPEKASDGQPFGAGGSGVVGSKIYYFGGWDSAVPEFTPNTWMFDPTAPDGEKWTDTGCDMADARAYINTAVSDGKIYAIGGDTDFPGDLVPTDLVEVFDPADPGACWQTLAPLPAASSQGRGSGFDDDTENVHGKLYIVGGGDWPEASTEVFEYDIATDTWNSEFPEIAEARRNHAGAFVSDCTPDPNDPFPSMWIFGGWIGQDAPPFGGPEYYPLSCGEVENTVHVSGMEGFFGFDFVGRPVLRTHVGVEDQDSKPLALVEVDASIWVPDGGPFQRTRLTKPSGSARFHWGSISSGTWSLCVDDLTLAGYVYNPGDNVVTCMDWYR